MSVDAVSAGSPRNGQLVMSGSPVEVHQAALPMAALTTLLALLE